MLTIITLGAVSASEDMVSDDELTVSDETVDSVVEIDDSGDNEDVIAEDNEEIIGDDGINNDKLSYDEDDEDVECYIYDVFLDDEDDNIVSFYSYDSDSEGYLKVYVNNVVKYQRYVDYDDYEDEDEFYLRLYPSDLGISLEGDYTIKVTFLNDVVRQETIHAYAYTFNLYASLDDDSESESYFEYGDTIIFNVVLPADATNKLTLNVNGRTYDVNYNNGKGKLSVSTAGWNLGSYRVTANYAGNYKYSSGSRSETIYLDPKINNPYYMSVGEQEYITFTAPSGNGNMVITGYRWNDYQEEYVQFTVQNVNIVNGRGSYSLASLPADDDYKFNVRYQVGSYGDDFNVYLQVKQNSPGFSSSVTPTTLIVGNNVNVQVSGPRLNSMVRINVDDNTIKSVSLINGQINEVLSGLPVGTHKINIFYDDEGVNFYSSTVYVTVKPVPPVNPPAPVKTTLALKKVKVKKSAKKLVLSATLKINGKAQQSKKITFKFNKKTFVAKTNKNGVAKVTIKKNILKKLKKGKKVTYTATYGKFTKKVTVKVKK